MPIDAGDTMDALAAMMARLQAAGPKIVTQVGLVIQREGMARTHVRTGALRRSWRVESEGDTAQVGPTMVYGRRQELGFLPPLVDSLGRQFPHAVGWPYVKPAYEASGPQALAVAVAGVREAIGG